MKYAVLDDIAYERVAADDGTEVLVGAMPKKRHASAKPGDVVELNARDAAALMKRGAVRALPAETVEVVVVSPKQLEK